MFRHMLLVLTTLLLLTACGPSMAVSFLGEYAGLPRGSDPSLRFEPEQGTSDRQPHGAVFTGVAAHNRGKPLPGTPEDVWVYTAAGFSYVAIFWVQVSDYPDYF